MAKDPKQMTKAQLIAQIRKLQRRIDGTDPRLTMDDWRVYQDQAHAQSQQLIDGQKDLADAFNRFMDIYDSAPVAFATLDRNGIIEEINQTGQALLRLQRDQILKRPLLVFVFEADRKLFLDHMTRCRKTASPCRSELRLKVRGGKPVLVQLTSRPATRMRTGGTSYLTAITDLTPLRAAEAERQRLAMQAESARAASEAKDHFLAVLSHELRTPLAPVMATLEMLKDNPRLDGEVRESLEMIRRNVQLEASLIDDLLDVTRIAKGKIEMTKARIELGEVVRSAAEVCLPEIRARKIDFAIDACDEPCPIEGDPVRLQQVVWNLIKNSVKFTPDGGCIGVRCSRNGASDALVQVSDSGRGIEPELLPKLFTAFEQGGTLTTRRFGGLGLGLAISKTITELHGGSLSAESQGPGKGATFTLKLPLAAPQAPAAATRARPVSAPSRPVKPRQALHILLVEDHLDTARIMKKLLATHGHTVELAGDIAGAVDLARQQTFDLLLSDLGLPDGSGLDLIRAIRSQGSHLPAIALSGFGQEKDVEESRLAGFTAHLTKPVNLPKLEQAMALAMANNQVV